MMSDCWGVHSKSLERTCSTWLSVTHFLNTSHYWVTKAGCLYNQNNKEQPLQNNWAVIMTKKYIKLLQSTAGLTCLTVTLYRFREVLAANTVRPWELPSVFKHVIKDILRQKEYDEEDILPWQAGQHQEMDAWTSCYRMKQSFLTSTVPNCDHPREEIPTISGYVDWAMRQSSSFTGSSGGWGPPYYSHCYPVPLRPIGAYSTSLW